MRLIEILNRIDSLKQNQLEDAVKRSWLSDMEEQIVNEVVKTHEMPERVLGNELVQRYLETGERMYDENTDPDTELIAPPPYDDLYFWWLAAKVDLINLDNKQYKNDYQMYNNAYLTFQDYWNRTYMPIQKVCSFLSRAGKEKNDVFT